MHSTSCATHGACSARSVCCPAAAPSSLLHFHLHHEAGWRRRARADGQPVCCRVTHVLGMALVYCKTAAQWMSTLPMDLDGAASGAQWRHSGMAQALARLRAGGAGRAGHAGQLHDVPRLHGHAAARLRVAQCGSAPPLPRFCGAGPGGPCTTPLLHAPPARMHAPAPSSQKGGEVAPARGNSAALKGEH